MPSEPYDPEVHGTYGAYLRAKHIHTRPRGWTSATRDIVREGRDKSGRRFKHTTDQLGNEVVQHGSDQQSVKINAPHVRVASTTTEERAYEQRQ